MTKRKDAPQHVCRQVKAIKTKVMCLYPNMHIRVSACVLVAPFLINGALTTAFRN